MRAKVERLRARLERMAPEAPAFTVGELAARRDMLAWLLERYGPGDPIDVLRRAYKAAHSGYDDGGAGGQP